MANTYTPAAKRAAAKLDADLLDMMAEIGGGKGSPHVIVAKYQRERDLEADGWPGAKTLAALWLDLRPGPKETRERMFHAATMGVRYKLGRGGFGWLSEEIGDQCDCSGFVCWALGLSRKPSPIGGGVWWSTDSIRADAIGEQTVFRQVEPGSQPAFVVYGDYRRGGAVRQGHVGFVVDPQEFSGYDCSSSQSRRHGQAITYRDLSFFGRRESTVWCVPVWWSTCD